MKLQDRLTKTVLLAGALALTTLFSAAARADGDEYSFKIRNNSEETIIQLLVSEDGEKYNSLDIGDGIEPGDIERLTWDKSTKGESCHQWFKAVWVNGREGKPVEFDFCEEGVILVF